MFFFYTNQGHRAGFNLNQIVTFDFMLAKNGEAGYVSVSLIDRSTIAITRPSDMDRFEAVITALIRSAGLDLTAV